MSLVLDVLFLGFGISLILMCAKRGLILTLLKFFKMILSIVAARAFGGAFGTFVGEKFLNAPIRNMVYRKVNDVYLSTAESFGVDTSLEALPGYMQNEAVKEQLNGLEETGDALVNSITDTVAGSISSVVCGIIGFALVFVAVFLALSILYVLIQKAKKLFTSFGKIDAVCGGVLGCVFACMILLFAGSALKFFCGNQPAYQDSTIVKFFGESNLTNIFEFLNPAKWLNELMTKPLQ